MSIKFSLDPCKLVLCLLFLFRLFSLNYIPLASTTLEDLNSSNQ